MAERAVAYRDPERDELTFGRSHAVCATPGCSGVPGHGRTGRFCAGCAERLSGVSDQLAERRARKYRIYGTRDLNKEG